MKCFVETNALAYRGAKKVIWHVSLAFQDKAVLALIEAHSSMLGCRDLEKEIKKKKKDKKQGSLSEGEGSVR
jgi:hypothetical protein